MKNNQTISERVPITLRIIEKSWRSWIDKKLRIGPGQVQKKTLGTDKTNNIENSYITHFNW